jgi:hypothetical protein
MLARTGRSAGQSSSDAYKTGLSSVTLLYRADHKRNTELCAGLGEFENIDWEQNTEDEYGDNSGRRWCIIAIGCTIFIEFGHDQ